MGRLSRTRSLSSTRRKVMNELCLSRASLSPPADTSVYWQSVILNDKENLEEDAIIGVLKEDSILQAIGARHSGVFQPSADGALSQEDFPIHYSAQMTSLSPSSSTSSLHEPNQRHASTDHEIAEQKVFFIQSSSQNNGFNLAEDEQSSVASPVESVHDPASDSSFTSQDTIIVMTKEILKGNMSPFEENMDEDLSCPHHLAHDPGCPHCENDADHMRSGTPASDRSDDSSSIGRFRIVSCPDDEAAAPQTPVKTDVHDSLTNQSEVFSKQVTTDETKVQSESVPVCTESEIVSSRTSSESPIDANIGRFHVVNYSQELSIDPVVSDALPADAPRLPKKKAPPPPPAKPPIAILRQRMSSHIQNLDSSEGKKRPADSVDCNRPPPLPTRSGSVPNALVSVSEIRKAFERRGTSLEEHSAPVSSEFDFVVPRPGDETASPLRQSNTHRIESVPNPRSENTDNSATELPAAAPREQRPKSFPSDSSYNVIFEPPHFSSLSRHDHMVKMTPESISNSTTTAPSQPPTSSNAEQQRVGRRDANSESSGVKKDLPVAKAGEELVEYTEEPRTLVPSKRTSSLANFHSLPTGSHPSPATARIVHSQPIYLSLNRRDPHQLFTLYNPYCPSATGQPPVRAAVSSAPGPPLPPPRPVRGPLLQQERQTSAGPAARPLPVLFPSQQLIQTPAGLVSHSPIYGYIRNCSAQSAAGNHVHYHHSQLLLQAASQKLRSCEDFPPPNEIRRRDGINAFPQVWQEAPAPGKFPVSSVPEHTDELEQFVQQEQDRTERIRQRYAPNEEDSSDDPTFGFSNRPAVRGIRTHDQPRTACIPCSGGQVFVQPVGLTYSQPRLVQQQRQAGQQPVPPGRHVYLVRAPNCSTLVPLPRGVQNMAMLRPAVPQQTGAGNERPASSLGPVPLDVHAGCPQCSLIQQRLRMEQNIDPGPEQVVYPVRVPNGASLTYKTISMPNVAMIRPVGLLSMVPNQRTNETKQSSPNDTSSQPRTSTLTAAMSASAALSMTTGAKTQMHNNNPDLVIDATMSRTSGSKAVPVACSSPMPSSSSNASSSLLHGASTAPFLKKKDVKSKEEKKKSKKEKRGRRKMVRFTTP